MFWYKGWLETRFRLLFVFGFYAVLLLVMSLVKPPQSSPFARMNPQEQLRAFLGFGFAIYPVAMASLILAAAGITTQSSFQQSKGLPGSTLFTLSLPVSRLRLLATRAGLGWLETAAFICALCLLMHMVVPQLRAMVRPEEMAAYAVTLIMCSAGIYAVPVLLATFLDDLGRMLGSVPVLVALWWLLRHAPLPASMDPFRSMGEASPLVSHTMPWKAMAFSLALAALLFFVALKVVRRRQY
jgi:hypothetical protein